MGMPGSPQTVQKLVDDHYVALYRYAYRLSGSSATGALSKTSKRSSAPTAARPMSCLEIFAVKSALEGWANDGSGTRSNATGVRNCSKPSPRCSL